VTRVQYPNGRVLKSVLDVRGLDSLVVDSTGSRAGVSDTTRFEYDPRWLFVTKSVPPERDSTTFEYDVNNGNRLWQQDARGSASRVNYTYHASGSGIGQLATVTPPGATPDSVVYDAFGNVERIRDALGSSIMHLRDGAGRVDTVVTPIDASYSVIERRTYDLMDRVTETRTKGPAVSYPDRFGSGNPISFAAQSLIVGSFYDAEGNLDSLVRTSDPDVNGINRIRTAWKYDGANRKAVETAPDGRIDSLFYDPAGNQTRWITRRGDTISMAYDALNRPERRIVPSVSYAELQSGVLSFPKYSVGLTIRGDTATFAYDVMGNIVTANNGDAQVARTYNLTGTVETDTLRIRTYTGVNFSRHVYGLRYGYDRNGRRRWLKHPGSLAPSATQDSVGYGYNDFGQLASVRDILGNRFEFFYDAQARLDSVAYPGGVWEKRFYDAVGRMYRRQQRSPIVGTDSGFLGGVIHDDTLTFDQRGRILTSRGARYEVHDVYYTGLGAVARGRDGSFSASAPTVATWSEDDAYTPDALGNNQFVTRVNREVARNTYVYQMGTGRLLKTGEAAGRTAGAVQDTSAYDEAGNLFRMKRKNWYRECAIDAGPCGVGNSAPYYEESVHYYTADNRLHLTDKRSELTVWNLPNYAGAFEESRYDALGRRVLRRARTDCANCSSFIERVAFDGDQYLYETHFPAGDGVVSADSMENDTTRFWESQSGRVAYTHGGGLDQPLSVVRIDYLWREPTAVMPHQNWRGQFDAGTFANGAATRCTKTPQGTNASDCIRVNWQAQNVNVFYEQKTQATIDGAPYGYFGSVIPNKREASGQLFMRNRLVDPVSGRFTQEDPIGLAGGLNLYGFAKGDPVNFSDPFGLCVKDDINCKYLVQLLRRQKGSEFQKAAKQYDALKEGRVYFTTKAQMVTPAGEQLFGVAPVGKDGNVFLVGEQSKGDFLVTAVHEAKHLAGYQHGQALTQTVYDAWMQLGGKDRAAAVNSSNWLNIWTGGQKGERVQP